MYTINKIQTAQALKAADQPHQEEVAGDMSR
jgi:hypothetical protein